MQIKHDLGFTIVEVLIAFVIMGMVTALAAPRFSGLLKRYRLTNAAKVVWLDMHKARLTAIKQGKTAQVDFPPIVTTAYNPPLPNSACSYTTPSYVVRVNTVVVFCRNLATNYPGMTVSIAKPPATSLSFGSTGTVGVPGGGAPTIQIQGTIGSKSFTILTTTGRIGTIS